MGANLFKADLTVNQFDTLQKVGTLTKIIFHSDIANDLTNIDRRADGLVTGDDGKMLVGRKGLPPHAYIVFTADTLAWIATSVPTQNGLNNFFATCKYCPDTVSTKIDALANWPNGGGTTPLAKINAAFVRVKEISLEFYSVAGTGIKEYVEANYLQGWKEVTEATNK